MKVYSTPIPAPEPDYKNYDFAAEQKREEAHQEQVKQWLLTNGYAGPRTGQTIFFGVGDGHAVYMYADASRSSALIHLPYGDGYQFPEVRYIPKAEILKRMDQQAKRPKLLACV